MAESTCDRGLGAAARERGGEDYVTQAVSAHQTRLMALAGRMLGDEASAADVVQEAFARLAARLTRLDLERDAGPWLTRVAARLATDELRRRERRRRAEARLEPRSSCDSPDQENVRREELERLSSALAGLRPETHAALALSYGRGLSAGEVARELGISEAACKKRLARGRERLRRLLEGK
jgi:RNA polymerase sigma-70 factor (ECF subfamily)